MQDLYFTKDARMSRGPPPSCLQSSSTLRPMQQTTKGRPPVSLVRSAERARVELLIRQLHSSPASLTATVLIISAISSSRKFPDKNITSTKRKEPSLFAVTGGDRRCFIHFAADYDVVEDDDDDERSRQNCRYCRNRSNDIDDA